MEEAYVNGKKIYAFTSKDQFLDVSESYKGILIALNAEKLYNDDEKLNAIINNNLGYPDGIGAVLALKRKGVNSTKIAGAEFWLDLIKRHYKEKSFYVMGATQETIYKTVTKLKIDYPEIDIVGYRNGFLNKTSKNEFFKEILAKKPDIVFVAQGSPRQEFLMEQLFKVYPALYMGLGGSFDVYCGLKKRAPKIFIALGLEWFYRYIKEPTRFKRNLNVFRFIGKVITNKI